MKEGSSHLAAMRHETSYCSVNLKMRKLIAGKSAVVGR